MVLGEEALVFGMAIKGAPAVDGGEGDGGVEGGVEAIQIVEEVSDFVLKGGELNKGELLFLWMQVADDL